MTYSDRVAVNIECVLIVKDSANSEECPDSRARYRAHTLTGDDSDMSFELVTAVLLDPMIVRGSLFLMA